MENEERNILDVHNNENKLKLQGEESSTDLRKRVTLNQSNKLAEKVSALKQIIQGNIHGCDLIICIFIAALRTYRSESCLRPFPQCFIRRNNEKDFGALKSTCDKIPPLKEFLTLPIHQCSEDVVHLLSWLFIDAGLPVLKLRSTEGVPLVNKYERDSCKPPPQYIFEVDFSSKVNNNWLSKVNNREILYAFHGSHIDNFYSILKIGLQQHFSTSKEVLFGTGIYLSSEISVCTNYAPFGETWKNSILGNKHSIIALCEIINDADEVKCKDKNNKRRALNENSLGTIPEKYYVVTNSELVKIKYLLVYRNQQPSFVTSFIKKNILWIAMVLYIIMLFFIGFVNGPHWSRLLRFFSSFFEK